MEWELSKENVQPMKSGRNVEVLNDALKAKAEGHARVNIFENQRRQMLDAIENYSGNDPLHPWIRCIKWIKDAFPAGGAQSELLKLLEGCTRKFQKDERYRNDIRYLRVWVQYADCCTDPSDVFAFLEANDIGQTSALFYEAYATSMEVRRNFSRADDIYRVGISRHAQPLGRLENMYKSFLNRMFRRGERKIREEQELIANGIVNENEGQARVFGPTSHFSGFAEQQYGRERGRQTAAQPPISRTSKPKNTKLSIFVDPEFEGSRNSSSQGLYGEEPPASSHQPAAWCHLPNDSEKKKENVQQATKWSEAKIKQKIPSSKGQQAGLDIYVDEEFSEATSLKGRSKPVQAAAPPILKLRLEDMQSMKRTSPHLKGSFLDFSPTTIASAKQDAKNFRHFTAQEEGVHAKGSLPSILAYDTKVVNENGSEKCFEEVRLEVWTEKHSCHTQEDEVLAEKLDGCTYLSSLQTLGDVKDRENNAQGEGQNVDEGQVNSTDTPTREEDTDFSVGNLRLNEIVCIQGDEGDLPDYPVDALAEKSAATGIDLEAYGGQGLDERLTTSEVSSDHQSNALNSFSMQGDETIAIKRFADEIIVQGADPRVDSLEAASHHGLVEPTINTKECLADIMDWFNKPLESDASRSKARVSKDARKRSNNSVSKSGGFHIFVDEDLETQRPPVDIHKDEKRVKASTAVSNAAASGTQASGFQVFMDDDLDSQKPGRCDGSSTIVKASTSKPEKLQPNSSAFQILEDEDILAQPVRTKQSHRRTEAPTSRTSSQAQGVQIFIDDEFCAPDPVPRRKVVENQKLSSFRSRDVVSGMITFKIPEDPGLKVNPKLKNTTVGTSSTRSSSLATQDLGVFVDEEFRELPLSIYQPDKQNPDRSLQEDLCIAEDNENGEEPCERVEGFDTEHILAEALCVPASKPLKDEAGWQDKSMELQLFDRSLPVDSTCQSDMAGDVDINSLITVKEKEKSDAALTPVYVDPWDQDTIRSLLTSIQHSVSSYEGLYESNLKYGGSLPGPSVRATKTLELGNSVYRLKGCVGEGAFAKVFEAEDADDDYYDEPPTIAIKFQKPPCLWEFYIYRQLDIRVSNHDRRYYGYAHRMYLYSDCSFMICEYGDKGTLQDVVNAYLAVGEKMEEVMCMFYTIEILRMVEILHSVGIIHGDIKPDNFLIRDKDGRPEDWAPDLPGFWKSQGLCLIDWGRSIDVSLYPNGTKFQGDSKTDSFRCPEMLEGRPWTFQVDTFGLCGVIHCLLHGSYMEVEKVQTAEGQTSYRPKTPIKRYWSVLWKELFDTLLNAKDFGDIRLLTLLRQSFEKHMVEKSWGRKLKGAMSKQTIMMFTSTRR